MTKISPTQAIESTPDLTPRQQRALARAERKGARNTSKKPSLGRVFIAGCIATSVAAGAFIVDKATDIIPGVPDVDINPGQQLGDTTFTDAQVDAFRVQSVDAIGTAKLKVDTIRQEIVDQHKNDEKARAHENLIFTDAVFSLEWDNRGAWVPKRTKDGLEIELPPVQSDGKVGVVNAPKLDKNRSDRAFWQSAAGLFGASDTQAGDFSDPINTLAGQIESDKDVVGNHKRATACAALASASQKAKSIADGLGVTADIETYSPPRSTQVKQTSTKEPNGTELKKITFSIDDPKNPGKKLDLESCLPTLDGVGYNNKNMATPNHPQIGLLPVHIGSRTLPPLVQ